MREMGDLPIFPSTFSFPLSLPHFLVSPILSPFMPATQANKGAVKNFETDNGH